MTRQTILALIDTGMTLHQIALRFGVGIGAIDSALRKAA
jgi:hypothetical protein